MRSTGLTAANWVVITEYQGCLEPLKFATALLEGRSKADTVSATYEAIIVFEYILGALKDCTRPYERGNFNYADAPEGHTYINLRAAWSKANNHYNKLENSPAYYTAVCLYSYYKHYCDNSWADKLGWLNTANARF